MINLMMTTGFSFEGYKITRYLGVKSGESALGTGFLSSFEAGLADLLGNNSSLYSDKLSTAKDYAISALVRKVENVGGNAIIGVSLNYTTFSQDIMGVIATGTAVQIEAIDGSVSLLGTENDNSIAISGTNIIQGIRPENILSNFKGRQIALRTYCAKDKELKAIRAHLLIENMFGENFQTESIDFLNFASVGSNRFDSVYVNNPVPEKVAAGMSKIRIVVTKYVTTDGVFDVSDCEVVDMEEQRRITSASSFDYEAYYREISGLPNSKAILNYTRKIEEKAPGTIKIELMDIIEQAAKIENFYGNNKMSCLQNIQNYLDV